MERWHLGTVLIQSCRGICNRCHINCPKTDPVPALALEQGEQSPSLPAAPGWRWAFPALGRGHPAPPNPLNSPPERFQAAD